MVVKSSVKPRQEKYKAKHIQEQGSQTAESQKQRENLNSIQREKDMYLQGSNNKNDRWLLNRNDENQDIMYWGDRRLS